MVIETLLNPKKFADKPLLTCIVSFCYVLVSALTSYIIFGNYASLGMIFFTVLLLAPFMLHLLEQEENEAKAEVTHAIFAKEMIHISLGMIFVFLGATFAFLVLGLFVPDTIKDTLFSIHKDTISVQGYAVQKIATYSSSEEAYQGIILNNLKVIGFSVLLAFVFGLGAITVIIWNASTVGYAMALIIDNALTSTHWFFALATGLVRYLPHGIFEIGAYLLAGLGAGIISVAITKHEFGSHRWKTLTLHAVELILVAVAMIFVAGLIEVYITPLLSMS